jgi:dynein heavy chain, axonemal
MNFLHNQDPKKYPGVKVEILNPKSITDKELFGWVDSMTNEWNDGVLSTMMSRLCKEESQD